MESLSKQKHMATSYGAHLEIFQTTDERPTLHFRPLCHYQDCAMASTLENFPAISILDDLKFSSFTLESLFFSYYQGQC